MLLFLFSCSLFSVLCSLFPVLLFSVFAGLPSRQSETNPAIDMAAKVMDTLLTCLATYTQEKLLWNICHAVGRVMGSFSAYDEQDTFMATIEGGRSGAVGTTTTTTTTTATTATPGGLVSQPHQCIVTGMASAWIVAMSWYESLLVRLAAIASTCPNFKVRIHAVAALSKRCSGRKDYCSSAVLGQVLKSLITAYLTMVRRVLACVGVFRSHWSLVHFPR